MGSAHAGHAAHVVISADGRVSPELEQEGEDEHKVEKAHEVNLISDAEHHYNDEQ